MKNWKWLPWIVAFALIAVLRSAGGLEFWHRYLASLYAGEPVWPGAVQPQSRIAGEAAGMPRSEPADQGIEPEAVAEAIREAGRQGVRALIVHRRAHLVGEHFGEGITAESMLSGGELSTALLALAMGDQQGRAEDPGFWRAMDAVLSPAREGWRNPWSAAARAQFGPPATLPEGMVPGTDVAQFISMQLWRRLGAGDAWLWGAGQQVRLDCCVQARVGDWIRLGDLMLQQGNWEGERITPPSWVRRLLAAPAAGAPMRYRWTHAPETWTGDEPPAARETLWIDLGTEARLWLVPQRGLAVLVWSGYGKAQARDTTLPNILIRGIVDMPVSTEEKRLSDMVPGH